MTAHRSRFALAPHGVRRGLIPLVQNTRPALGPLISAPDCGSACTRLYQKFERATSVQNRERQTRRFCACSADERAQQIDSAVLDGIVEPLEFGVCYMC